jgi:hypothetical protein
MRGRRCGAWGRGWGLGCIGRGRGGGGCGGAGVRPGRWLGRSAAARMRRAGAIPWAVRVVVIGGACGVCGVSSTRLVLNRHPTFVFTYLPHKTHRPHSVHQPAPLRLPRAALRLQLLTGAVSWEQASKQGRNVLVMANQSIHRTDFMCEAMDGRSNQLPLSCTHKHFPPIPPLSLTSFRTHIHTHIHTHAQQQTHLNKYT